MLCHDKLCQKLSRINMHINANVYILCYECETYMYFILKAERKLSVFENQVLIRRFGLKRMKITFQSICILLQIPCGLILLQYTEVFKSEGKFYVPGIKCTETGCT
jgi:hypothetical protein